MPLRNHKFEQKQNTERPQPVAPTSRSRLRERPRCVAARGRSGLVLASPGDENASDFSLSLWYGRSELRERLQHVALEGRSERPHAVAPRGRSGSARPKITLITSFLAPNAPKCLQKLHVFEQKQNTERPQPVAPTSRSRLRERPRCVAARGRSGLVLASPGDENASDFSLSLWYGRSELRERLQHVALEGRSERPHAVAPRGRSGSARPKITLITSFLAPNAPKCLQKLHVVLKYLIETYACKMQPRHG
ncbi:hypothetical protein IGI04_034716 [Brassica rapa subsp. trilocularis]|uniref:Uncharacterized protein n=1 Tax=Brassica rapa subsp. trilocularis TaxID=1813537 RepID=A0ABQ7LBV4_BRACM|nr:hypothetical protein IGI04_034716 [Brassica rapa subsp. trilocularis]